MSELAKLLEWANIVLKEMLAHLSLIFLFESVELALVTIKIIVIRLLSEMLQNLAWWVVEVSWSTFGVQSLALIFGLWFALRVEAS